MSSLRLLPMSPRATVTTFLSLALGAASTLAFPKMASADEPAQLPPAKQAPSSATAQPPSDVAQPPSGAAQPPSGAAQPPSGGDAQPPSGAQTPAPAAPKELPASVLAMQGKDVVLRLDEGPAVVGRLESVNNQVFYVRDPTGAINGIPRSRVRGIRLSEVQAPPPVLPSALSPVADPSDPMFPHKERSIGFGTSFGGGFSGAGEGINGAFLLPTVDLQVFLPSEYSVDVSVPVLNMALSSALLGGTLFATDLYLNVNAGKGKNRFVAGPGIGFAYAKVGYREVSVLKIPFQLGFELLSSTRMFGFKMAMRPWIEVPVGRPTGADVGGGILAVMGFSGYVLSDRPSP